jgi:hypothetical protein
VAPTADQRHGRTPEEVLGPHGHEKRGRIGDVIEDGRIFRVTRDQEYGAERGDLLTESASRFDG